MPDVNVLVIAVDGLRASALGAYGNTAYLTPALDQFAAESFLLDNCFANSTELRLNYRSLWESVHPLRRDAAVSLPSLSHLLSSHGYVTALLTDDPAVAALPAATGFDECVTIADAVPERRDDLSETSMARLFATACEQLTPSTGDAAIQTGPRFVWVHARGMYGPWDAPLELQEPLLESEEGDPSPCESLLPPDVDGDAATDPDAAFRWSCGYAAQIIVLDACLDGLSQSLRELSTHEEWLVVLCGIRGFPLGEHGRVGGIDARLFAEQLHVPLLWRSPNCVGRLARGGVLTTHVDLLPTLLDAIDCRDRSADNQSDGLSLLPLVDRPTASGRDAIVAAGAGGIRSIRTADWSLRREPVEAIEGVDGAASASADDDRWRRELYVRPDDRWEANDVASLCSDVVAMLDGVLAEAERALERGESLPVEMLPGDVRSSAD